MDTPRDLSKPLRTALIACICLTLLSMPAIGVTTIIVEDYEDGGVGDWNSGQNVNVGFNGDRSLNLDNNNLENEAVHSATIDSNDAQWKGTIRVDSYEGSYLNLRLAGTNDEIRIRTAGPSGADETELLVDDGGSFTGAGAGPGIDMGQWYYYNITAQGDVATTEIVEADTGTVIYDASVDMSSISFSDGDVRIDASNTDSDTDLYLDNQTIGGVGFTGTSISGTVVDGDSNGISGASIEVTDSTTGDTVATAQTDDVGAYSVVVGDGEYDVTASKSEYRTETKTVTVSGSDETVDFQLESLEASIELDTRSYLEHGTTAPYSVIVDNGTGRADVTDSSSLTVTSNDTNVVTVDTTNNEIVATSDTAVNDRTYIEAEYTDTDGTVYTARQNVTVANKTVENLKILPTGPRLSASLGANADQDPTANTIPVIIVAMILGAGVTLFARSFAGLMAATLVITLGWIGGMVGNGMIIVTIMTAIMIGLNVATNVDYSVRR